MALIPRQIKDEVMYRDEAGTRIYKEGNTLYVNGHPIPWKGHKSIASIRLVGKLTEVR